MIVSVSTDVGGLFCQSAKILKVYGPTLKVLKQHGFDGGFEVIGWRFNLQKMIRELGHINGIHGRVGILYHDKNTCWRDVVVTELINQLLLMSTSSLLDETSSGYILIHEGELLRTGMEKLLIANKGRIKTLMLENNPTENSLANTLIKVDNLNNLGVNTGVMIDLLHLSKELMGKVEFTQNNWSEVWDQVLVKMDFALQRTKMAGFHIPIGSTNDSLPIKLMSEVQWKKLGGLIRKHKKKIKYVTLENQQMVSPVFLLSMNISEISKRTANMVEVLIGNEVIVN